MRASKWIVSFAAVLVLIVSGAWALVLLDDKYWDDDDNYQKFEETFSADLGGITKVEIHNINGAITAEHGSGDVVNILSREKVRENHYIDPAELANEVRLVSHREGSTLVIELDYGRYKDDRHRGYYQSSFEVTMPQRLSVYLETTNGSIEAPLYDGDVDLHTTNGSVRSEGSGGIAKLETTNGSIYIAMVTGRVQAETTNGNISIASIAGPVNAETTNGSIEVNLRQALAGDVTLETTNGGITFNPGPGSSYTLRADASHGKVYSDEMFDYNRRRSFATGSVGGGKYRVRMETTNGSIRINQ